MKASEIPTPGWGYDLAFIAVRSSAKDDSLFGLTSAGSPPFLQDVPRCSGIGRVRSLGADFTLSERSIRFLCGGTFLLCSSRQAFP